MEKYYTGVGSRQTPLSVLILFEETAYSLAKQGWKLRSGHAPGSDKSFETGCDSAKGKKDIYLPWKEFEGSDSDLIVSDPKAFELGEIFHPRWSMLSFGAKKLQARNSHQVLGTDLNIPSEFVLCWTEKGKGQGGTGQAIRIAEYYNIPIFDAGRYKDIKQCKDALISFLSDFGIDIPEYSNLLP